MQYRGKMMQLSIDCVFLFQNKYIHIYQQSQTHKLLTLHICDAGNNQSTSFITKYVKNC